MTFKSAIKPHAEQLKNYLLIFLDQSQDCYKHLKWSDDAFFKLKKFVVSGKLLRGSLFLLAAEQFSKTKSKIDQINRCQIASAIELAQTAFLIQDDYMDNDLFRRGQDSIFYQYQQQFQKLNSQNSNNLGIYFAICISDLCLFLASNQLSTIKTDPQIMVDLSQIFNQKFIHTVFGQMQDLEFGNTSIEPFAEEIIKMYLNKTAHYTIALPLLMAAIYTKQSNQMISLLDKIGQHLGVIFQIKDDSLAIFGNQNKIGKAVGNDVVQNKKTLLRYYLYHQSQNSTIKSYFGQKTLSKQQLQEIIKELKMLKIDQKVNTIVNSKAKLIKKLMVEFNLSKAQTIIAQLLEYSLSREK